MPNEIMYSCYDRYHNQSLGRVLHFLYHYIGGGMAEVVTVGDGKIDYYGEVVAAFKWEGTTPVFEFSKKFEDAAKVQDRLRSKIQSDPRHIEYLSNQLKAFKEAIAQVPDLPITNDDKPWDKMISELNIEVPRDYIRWMKLSGEVMSSRPTLSNVSPASEEAVVVLPPSDWSGASVSVIGGDFDGAKGKVT